MRAVRHQMDVCPRHRRWTFIQNADGTTAKRRCPECPAPRGARIVNQFTHEVIGRMPPELIEAVADEAWVNAMARKVVRDAGVE